MILAATCTCAKRKHQVKRMSAWTPPDVNGRSPPYLGYFSKTVVVDGSMMPHAIFLPFLSWITTVRPNTSSFPRPVCTSLDSTFDELEVYLTDNPLSQSGEPAGSSQLVPPRGQMHCTNFQRGSRCGHATAHKYAGRFVGAHRSAFTHIRTSIACNCK